MRHALQYVILTAIALAAWAAVPVVAAAQVGAQAPQAGAQMLSGKIVSIEGRILTVRGDKGEKQFSLDPSAKITQGQRSLKPDELRPGAEVTIQYTEKGGQQVAQRVSVKEGADAGGAQQQQRPQQPSGAQQQQSPR